MLRIVAMLAVLPACGIVVSDDLYFTFDDRRLLCAFAIDDFNVPVDWDRLQDRIDTAVEQHWIMNVYAHAPGVTIAMPTLERAFSMFERAGLVFTTYPDFDPEAPPYAGVAFGFDDDSVEAWYKVRPLLERHHANVTFFVTYFDTFTADQRAQLHVLADDGNAIESHSVHHLDADTYPGGPEAYLADEVLPSFAALRADGFTPESFAYPGGRRTPETDAAIAPHVRYLRTTPGLCDR